MRQSPSLVVQIFWTAWQRTDVRCYLMTLLLACMLTGLTWAQDVDTQEEAAAAAEAVDVAEETPADAGEQDDSDLDEQGYADSEDDDFIPSEDIQSDKSISFPTDI